MENRAYNDHYMGCETINLQANRCNVDTYKGDVSVAMDKEIKHPELKAFDSFFDIKRRGKRKAGIDAVSYHMRRPYNLARCTTSSR